MLPTLAAALLTTLFGCGKAPEPHEIREMKCNAGDMDVCYEIGTLALDQARPDVPKARKMFSKGCNVHHPKSCNQLADMVRDARGGPKDIKRAAELYGIACNKGLANACVNLATFYYTGEGVKKDAAKAVELFTTACNAEPPDAMACSMLGVAWADGEGVEKKDDEMAEQLQEKACAAKYAEGCVKVGQLNQERRGVRKSKEEHMAKAAEFFEMACTINARHGCYELAMLHREGDAPESTDDKAAIFFQKTCNIDPTRGCFEAAELMAAGKITAREGEIESLYNLACEHGHTEACAKRNIDLDELKKEQEKK